MNILKRPAVKLWEINLLLGDYQRIIKKNLKGLIFSFNAPILRIKKLRPREVKLTVPKIFLQ